LDRLLAGFEITDFYDSWLKKAHDFSRARVFLNIKPGLSETALLGWGFCELELVDGNDHVRVPAPVDSDPGVARASRRGDLPPGENCPKHKWADQYERLIWICEVIKDQLNSEGYPFNIADVEMALFVIGGAHKS